MSTWVRPLPGRGQALSWPAPVRYRLLLSVLMLVALGTAAVAAGVAGTAEDAPSGVSVAGPLTDWAAAATRVLVDLAVCGVSGSLLVAGLLLRAGSPPVAGDRLLRAARGWAGLLASAAGLGVVATTAQVAGVRLSAVPVTPPLYRFAWQLPQGRALLVLVLASVVVILLSRRVRGGLGAFALVALVSLAIVPMLATGHAGSSAHHYLATQALVVHVLALTLWVGGLLAIAVHLRTDQEALAAVLPAFSGLALACYLAVAGSGAVGAWVRLGFDSGSWVSAYGALLLVKTALLTVLGGFGAWHRARAIRLVRIARPAAFRRLAAGELVVMAATVGLGVALSRTQPPADALARVNPPHANTFATVDRTIDPVGPWSLLTASRPDALVVTALVVIALGYGLGVCSVRRRHGPAWPAIRTAAFAGGLLVVLWALVGGLGAYSAALLSAQVAQLLTMAFVASPLLVLGAPLRLVRELHRGAGHGMPRDLPRGVSEVNGLVALVVVLTGVYASGLLEVSLRSQVVHLAVALAALAAGCWFWWPFLTAPISQRITGDRQLLLGVLATVVLAFAAQLWRTDSIVGGGWFSRLDWWWSDAFADQHRAAQVAAGFGLAVAVSAVSAARPAHRSRT